MVKGAWGVENQKSEPPLVVPVIVNAPESNRGAIAGRCRTGHGCAQDGRWSALRSAAPNQCTVEKESSHTDSNAGNPVSGFLLGQQVNASEKADERHDDCQNVRGPYIAFAHRFGFRRRRLMKNLRPFRRQSILSVLTTHCAIGRVLCFRMAVCRNSSNPFHVTHLVLRPDGPLHVMVLW